MRELGQSLLIFDVAVGLGKLPALPVTSAQARQWLELAQVWIAQGLARYLLISGQWPRVRGLEEAREPDPIVDEVKTGPDEEERAEAMHMRDNSVHHLRHSVLE